ncbi:Glyoxalase/bleomycin resistance protein/dioxygenase [Fusarium austroafricanum]|uniref:Glyoxalase/bleomycin resistance protein/dioxygenase n=1 Tax=Fusarium austroafricanum TaxID=2364996 RepID=A0A8H4P113_9HYPO|nr:Glyoxalase/bleomycin resistance protein/dioxygenase [Fusarium austroafricanum]
MHFTIASLALFLGSTLATTPAIVPGSDVPSDPATAGYFVNHVGITVSNVTRSLDFYTQVFGFRHMFTFQATSEFSITYLGHSSGGKNGTGFQTAEEMTRNKNNMAGQISLFHLNAAEEAQVTRRESTNSFRLVIGIVVPDIEKAQERLEKYGAVVYKGIGQPMPEAGPLGSPYAFGDASDLSDEGWKAIKDVLTKTNEHNLFAGDPDGNLLEVLSADEMALMD